MSGIFILYGRRSSEWKIIAVTAMKGNDPQRQYLIESDDNQVSNFFALYDPLLFCRPIASSQLAKDDSITGILYKSTSTISGWKNSSCFTQQRLFALTKRQEKKNCRSIDPVRNSKKQARCRREFKPSAPAPSRPAGKDGSKEDPIASFDEVHPHNPSSNSVEIEKPKQSENYQDPDDSTHQNDFESNNGQHPTRVEAQENQRSPQQGHTAIAPFEDEEHTHQQEPSFSHSATQWDNTQSTFAAAFDNWIPDDLEINPAAEAQNSHEERGDVLTSALEEVLDAEFGNTDGLILGTSIARAAVKRASPHYIGRRARRSVRAALSVILRHHAGNLLEQPPSVQAVWRMTWFCSSCRKNNPDHAETCMHCHAPWHQVWKPSKKKARERRSHSQQPKAPSAKDPTPAESDPAKKPAKSSTPSMDWNVFPETAPWIPSTPTTRHTTYRSDTAGEVVLPVPPAPSLPSPPKPSKTAPEALTAEEAKLLTHLRGIVALGCPVPQEMQHHLEMLERKEKEMVGRKTLSHSHLNKVHKLTNQLQQSQKKIHALDQEWKEFTAKVQAQLQNHIQWYQQYRTSLLEAHQGKILALEAAKKELSAASQTLMRQPVALETVPDFEEAMPTIQQMQEALTQAAAVEEPEILSDTEDYEAPEVSMDELTELEDLEDQPKPTKTIAPKAFHRGAGSPKKVAQTGLKKQAR
eukprot:Skav222657  [mRNA]  locus=scaffold997:249908:252591:+ [translate_table: standard]